MCGRSRRLGGLLSWFALALMLSTVLMQAVRPQVHAAGLNSINNLTLKARIYSEYMLLASTHPDACDAKGGGDSLPSADKAGPSWYGGTAPIGMIVETDNGMIQCSRTGWLAEVISTATGSTDYEKLYNQLPKSGTSPSSTTLANYLRPFLILGTGHTGSENSGGGDFVKEGDILAMQYAAMLAAFTSPNGCNARQLDGTAAAGQTTANIYYYEPGVAANPTNFAYNSDNQGKRVPVGYGVTADGVFECKTIANKLGIEGGEKYANAARDWYNADPTNRTVGGADTNVAGKGDACQNLNIVIGWLLCPIIKLIDGAINTLDSAMESLMIIDKSQYDNDGVKQAWRAMRNIALAILLPIMLVMVIGTALDYGPFDPYTAKKAFPRLVFAVFFILLSYPFCVFLIELSNAAGAGLLGLVSAAFAQGTGNGPITLSSLLDGGDGILFSAFTGAGIWAVSSGMVGLPGIVFSFALVTIAGLLIGFLVLILRQIIILAAIIMAPVAILSWIFPGNDKLWKLWKESFQGALLFFVIFMAVVAMGRAFASLVGKSQPELGIIQPIIILIAYVGPYFLIKQIAAMGGSALSTLSGMSHGAVGGFFQNQQKKRAQLGQQMGQAARSGNLLTAKNRFAMSVSRNVGRAANIGQIGVNPNRWRGRMNEAMDQTTYNTAKEIREKSPDFAALAQDDDLLAIVESARSTGDAVRAAHAKGRSSEAIARVERVMKLGSLEAVQQAAGVARAGTGTAFGNDPVAMFETIDQLSHGNGDVATRLLGDMRAMAGQNGQILMGGAGFGDTLRAYNRYAAAPPASRAAIAVSVRDEMAENVLKSATPAQIANARQGHVEALAPVLYRRLQGAVTSGDQFVINRELASIAGLYDTMAATKKENAEALANGLFGQAIPDASAGGRLVSVRTLLDNVRANDVFLQMRREFNASTPTGYVAGTTGVGVPGATPGGTPGGTP